MLPNEGGLNQIVIPPIIEDTVPFPNIPITNQPLNLPPARTQTIAGLNFPIRSPENILNDERIRLDNRLAIRELEKIVSTNQRRGVSEPKEYKWSCGSNLLNVNQNCEGIESDRKYLLLNPQLNVRCRDQALDKLRTIQRNCQGQSIDNKVTSIIQKYQ